VPSYSRHDALCRAAVTVGVHRVGHGGVSLGVIEESAGVRHDARRTGPDEDRRPGLDTLRAFGRVAHHEDGLAKRRRLLLHAPRIGQHESAACHEGHEVTVPLWFDQPHVRDPAEQAIDVALDVRVEVHGVHEAVVWIAAGEGGDGLADLPDALAEVLAAVSGHENEGHVRPVLAQ
jgi:hypothetical protein